MNYRTFGTPRTRLGIGAAVLLAVGAAGGAGAVSLTRPTIEMAPTVPTAIAKLPATNGVVTVKGRVAEIYGDRLIVQDATGRTMVAGGREASANLTRGSAVMVQGRYDDGQLRASYLVDPQGRITEVGPRHGPGHGPGRDGGPKDGPDGGPDGGPRHGPGHGPGHDGPPPPPPADGNAPPPPPAGADAPPPPPAGAAPVAGRPVARGAVTPPPAPAPTAAPAPQR
ncbi:hypothetical protein [Sphingomonas mollis]|uniref:DUF5666 domain-containing protein n=1 Tax=Sphingomonas mollis TaxID=2795726 RepID=A0ABS0XRY3_9SPHN|nr:hypothetical protein [Sphingomonas sp. BT553]MBJ6122777.1 hypothetical protein [Sphingomonas sp. BT553]